MSDGGAFETRPAPPWMRPIGLDARLSEWRGDARVRRQLVLDHIQPGRAARTAPIPPGLGDAARSALRARGLDALYVHQVEAIEHALAGRDVVVATPTASGKSLCYNLPVIDTLAREAEARALYLFPTKALSRDQEEGLRDLLRGAGLSGGAVTYDGDTPGDARRAARERTSVLVTNPDMLHAGILPHHARWARFFSNLRFVIIDEVHAYRGVFGAHLSNVLRRLHRVARFHGADPRFLFSSATIGNPGAHASRLAGRSVVTVEDSGAPSAPRHVLVYNPPIVNAELGLRRSYVKCAVDRTIELLRAGVSTLVFGQSRNTVEVMLKYLRDRLPEHEIPAERIQAYRGGYLPETRRRIERGLRDGDIGCVVATNALELGIDIGDLDAVVCAGYPGTMAALWQRFGRGGRRGRSSLALFVPSSNPLDQFMAQHPRLLLESPIEEARIDPDNVEVLVQHLKCAAFELQFRTPEDGFGDLPAESLDEALSFLESHQVLRSVPARGGGTTWHWAAEAHPANHVSLRSPSFDNFVIIDVATDRNIAEMDFRSTHTMLHEQAIYQHEGLQYQVERLDYENHKAFVRKVAPDYFTWAMTHVRVSVLEREQEGSFSVGGLPLGMGWGEVDVVEKVVGYKKIKFHTHENVGYGDVHLPAVEKATTSLWITVPEGVVASLPYPRAAVMDGLRGWLVALDAVAAVGLMMDGRDLGTAFVDEPGLGIGISAFPKRSSAEAVAPGLLPPGSKSEAPLPPVWAEAEAGVDPGPLPPSTPHHIGYARVSEAARGGAGFEPTLYLYDAIPGGTGLAARLWEEREALLRRSAGLVAGCGCEDGCPSCVGPVVGTPDGYGRKSVALDLFRRLKLLEGDS